jgi:hypothetical protein
LLFGSGITAVHQGFISYVSDLFYPRVMQHLMEMRGSFKSAIRKSHVALNMPCPTINIHFEVAETVMVTKLNILTHKTDAVAPSG